MPTDPLIKNLLSIKPYDHPAPKLGLIETHIAWIILTGKYAYKIKKPVDFDFLDFSTLKKRKYYCEEELRLGQQFASEVYLSVVPITGTKDKPQINGSGPILEYAIKMNEFPQKNLLASLLKRGCLTEHMIEQLGELIARFHEKTTISPKESSYGLPKEVHAPTKQNFAQITPLLSKPFDIKQLETLNTWADRQFEQHQTLLNERKRQGFIRDCHGDLHLENIIIYNNKLVLFDRLEFNADLRWTDVIADLAFLMMDLTEKKQTSFANQLVNTYLQYTEDYQGLALLPYYLSYRAVVRAKIALFRLNQEGLNTKEKTKIQNDYYNYIKLADFFTRPSKPCLLITYGLSGSGKTTIAKKAVQYCGAIQINSDIIRKNLFNIPLHTNSKSELNTGIYSNIATEVTYKKMESLAKIIIKSGFTALVDASFLRHAQRTIFYNLSKEFKIPFYILHCQTSETEIEQRIINRLNNPARVSEANLRVLKDQKKNMEPLTCLEKEHTIIIDDQQSQLKNILKKICPQVRFEMLS